MRSNQGQSLMELVVVIAVIIIVVGALVFATIASLRNASFSQNQAQATKLAQEGLEAIRSGRDRNASINFGTSSTTWKEPGFWAVPITNFCGTPLCYFKFLTNNNLQWVGNDPNFNFDNGEGLIGGQFRRVIILSDDAAFAVQKTVTAVVKWTDVSGPHESRLTTILRKI